MLKLIGKDILHYKILEQIGQGGMGIVYKAGDTKLDRTVAIKFLPSHIAANKEERERFKIEAKAAAALNHPNIATIYAIEEADDEMFIVMEYIEGKELKEIIKSEICNPQSAVEYATQIAEGLQAAHEKGIIHRDIKSSNIMITSEGRVKIMDFGLAKVAGAAVQLTKENTTLGTAAYMSPEQAKGAQVDHRTDIWSFGILLYEMLAGKLPFAGDYEQAIIYSIINEQPQPVERINPAVPDKLEEIVGKSLNKDPAARYQNFAQILENLANIKSPALQEKKTRGFKFPRFKSAKPIFVVPIILFLLILIYMVSSFISKNKNSTNTEVNNKPHLERLAVLPFVNLKSDPQTNFLGYALADQIIGELTYVKNILVRPSSSVRKYEEKVPDIKTVSKDLHVDYVLTGNYLKQGDLIRLNIELVNASSDELLWREPIEVKYANAFALQDIVSKKVLSGLQMQFTPDERGLMQNNVPQNPVAYEYYLKAVSYPYTTESDQDAVNMLRKSIELDSSFAPAWAELGTRYHLLASYKFGGMDQIKLAEKYLQKALSLNPELLNALGNLAMISVEISNTDRAAEIIKKMIKINPNNPVAHFSLGYIYRYMGMLRESEHENDIAISLDPRKAFRSAGLTYLQAGRYQEALRAFDLDQESSFSRSWKGVLYMRTGDLDMANKYFDLVISTDPNSVWGKDVSALKAYLEGNNAKGIRLVKTWEETNPTDGEAWYGIADAYGLLGEKAGCIRALRKAVEGGYCNYEFMLKDSFLNSVRNKPGFQTVLAKAKRKHDAFKAEFLSEAS